MSLESGRQRARGLVAGLYAAKRQLAGSHGARKQVIVVSGGDIPRDGVVEAVDALRDAHIVVSCVGVQGADRNVLAAIADAGDGRLYLVDDLTALGAVLRRVSARF